MVGRGMRFNRVAGCVFVFPNDAFTIQSIALFDLVPCIIDVVPFLTSNDQSSLLILPQRLTFTTLAPQQSLQHSFQLLLR